MWPPPAERRACSRSAVRRMSPDRPRIAVGFAAPLLLAAFALWWFSRSVADPDLWGHVRFGQDILRAGSIPRVDPYSYRTSGQTWFNHEWLSEVVLAAQYEAAGPVGLVGLKLAVSLAILGLCYLHLRRRGLTPTATVALLISISVPFRMGLGTIRPQIFTYLGFLLLLLVLERASRGRQRWLWTIPILFAAWINLHGGVLAGGGVLGLWVAMRVAARLVGDSATPPRTSRILPFGLLGIASGLALLVNPYGPELLGFLWRTATVPRPEISEWTPLALMSLPGLFNLAFLGIGVAAFVGSRLRKCPGAVAVFAVTAVLPLISGRHYPLFALALVVLAGEHLADVAGRWRRPIPMALSRGIAVVSLMISLVLFGLTPMSFGCIRIEPFYFAFPTRAVALLREGGVRGNMAVPFEWGEYVIWHLGPVVKVSIDGRRETIYSDEAYRQWHDFDRGTGVWDALLKSAPTDLVLAANGSPTANLMACAGGWLPLYQDSCCVVFAREGWPGLGRLVATAVPDLPDDGGGLCFPGPGPGGAVSRGR